MSQANFKKQTDALTFTPDTDYVALYYSTDLNAWAYKDELGNVQLFSSVALQSRSLYSTARNQTGSTIPGFSVVYISGSSGTLPLLSLSQANSESASSKTYAVTKTSIANNSNGDLIVSGLIENIDTSSFSAGEALWLSPSVAGGVTTTKPTSPDHAVFIGTVIRSHPLLGSVEIKIQNGYELEELHNVSISTPSNNQVLKYNSSTSLWNNSTLASTDVSDFTEATQDASASLLTTATHDGVSVSYNDAGNNLAITNTDKGSSAVTTHLAASDPHPQYLTSAEGNAAYQPLDGDLTAVAALAGAGFAVRTTTNTWATRSLTTPVGSGLAITNQDGVFGSPAFTNTDKGSDAVSTHVGLADPHTQYALDTDLSSGLALKADKTTTISAGTSLNGGGDLSANRTINHNTFGTAGTYGSATNVPVITTEATGHVTSVTSTAIQIAQSQVTNLTTDLSGKANLAGGNTFTGNQSINGEVTIGSVAGTTLTNNPLSVNGNVNSFLQSNIQNISTGTSASGDMVVTADNGTDTTNFIDMGINNSTYSDPTFTINGPNDGYLYVQGGDLSIGTGTSNKIAFFTGDTLAANERARITPTGQFALGSTAPSASAKLQIDSTTQGFLMPRMTTAQRDAIATPAQGLQVFDTDLDVICTFDGSVWIFEIYRVVQNNQSSTSNTYANITELVMPTLPIGRYHFEFYGACQSTLTTNGVGIRLGANGATISALNATWSLAQAANGTDKDFEYSQLAATTDITSTGVLTANADFPVLGSGVFSLGVAGSIAAQIRSETNLVGCSVRINSTLRIRRITG
jgi:hypothetical protein